MPPFQIVYVSLVPSLGAGTSAQRHVTCNVIKVVLFIVQEEGQLPARGKLAKEGAEAAAVLAAAAAQGLMPDQAGASWRDNELYAAS